jgi:hypothetical protein
MEWMLAAAERGVSRPDYCGGDDGMSCMGPPGPEAALAAGATGAAPAGGARGAGVQTGSTGASVVAGAAEGAGLAACFRGRFCEPA